LLLAIISVSRKALNSLGRLTALRHRFNRKSSYQTGTGIIIPGIIGAKSDQQAEKR
jgi:hypothetical protein